MHGKGQLEVSSGARYRGGWSEGRFHDQGELKFADGSSYVGSWRHGLEHGTGALRLPDGKVYEGLWHKGEVRGRGRLTYPEERKCFVGQFRSSKPHGFGVMTHADGTGYEGQWQYGKPAGRGKWRTASGEVFPSDGDDRLITPVSSVRASPRARDGLPVFEPSSGPPSICDSDIEGLRLQEVSFDEEDQENFYEEHEEVSLDVAATPGSSPRHDAGARSVHDGGSNTSLECESLDDPAGSVVMEPQDKFSALDAQLSALDAECSGDHSSPSTHMPETGRGLPASDGKSAFQQPKAEEVVSHRRNERAPFNGKVGKVVAGVFSLF
ncbi:unnamed protein product [Polarella glacialis]|uniref:MORN repeat-containing protein 5 n=1 Tax=Polarella glacialis TaxID=89957 RepID=A0A813JJH7_POLGL|nr:unnamed protein product [Polarella glacialis]CAE8681688.1 unnamed protein product [Polarella glacialis]